MTSSDIFDEHEKKATWKKIWLLQDRDESTGEFNYFPGLTAEEREEWLSFLYGILEFEREVENGDRMGSPDDSQVDRDDPLADKVSSIYHPAQYSFGKNLKWIPWAEDAPSGRKRGRYADSYPRGGVLHWTAGHRNGLVAGNELMRSTGMLYLLGDKDGNIAQSDPLTHHGYHAGKSSHKFASGYVSDEYVGLELQAAGYLTKSGSQYKSWFGTTIPSKDVAVSKTRENIAGGAYHVFTQKQIDASRRLWCWLYLNNPQVFSIDRVVGHDEVSPGRKVDPGASIYVDGKILSMSEYRALLWNDVDRITEEAKKAA